MMSSLCMVWLSAAMSALQAEKEKHNVICAAVEVSPSWASAGPESRRAN